MENEKLKIGSSILHEANKELLTQTKDFESKHIATKMEKLISTIPTDVLGIALEVDKKFPQWADRKTSEAQHLTKDITSD